MHEVKVTLDLSKQKEIIATMNEMLDEIKRLRPYYYAWHNLFADARRESHCGCSPSRLEQMMIDIFKEEQEREDAANNQANVDAAE